MGVEHHLIDVGWVHADLVVPRTKVDLGEELDAVPHIEQLIDHSDREGILDGDRVESLVFNAEMPRPFGLLNEENWGRGRGGAMVNEPLLHHCSALTFQLVLMRCWIPIGQTTTGGEPGSRWMACSCPCWGGMPWGAVKMSTKSTSTASTRGPPPSTGPLLSRHVEVALRASMSHPVMPC